MLTATLRGLTCSGETNSATRFKKSGFVVSSPSQSWAHTVKSRITTDGDSLGALLG